MAPTNLVALIKRVTEGDLGDSASTYLNVWIYFNLIGNTILLPIVVATFLFSKNARRHPTLVNLCITWIFSGVFSLLLFYSKQHVGHEPDPSLCIAQASLLYGITPMWSVAVLAMFYYMVHTLRGEPGQAKLEGVAMAAMLSAPYIAQCSFTIAALVLAIQHPEDVDREHRFFFCSLRNTPLFYGMTIFTLIMCVAIIMLEVALACIIYRSWRSMRNIGVSTRLDFPLVLRVLLFGIYVALGMVVNILSMFPTNAIVELYGATAGTVVFLIFGTQADVIRTWLFWRKFPDPSPEPGRPLSLPSVFASRQSPELFRSAKSDKRFPFSEASTRTPSLASRHSKKFVRLHDEGEDVQDVATGCLPRQDKGKRKEQTRSQLDFANRLEMAESMRSPTRDTLEEERRRNQRVRPSPASHVVDEVGRSENGRRARREVGTRPKGPRKASISSMTPGLASSSTSSTTSTSVTKSVYNQPAAGKSSVSANSTTRLLGGAVEI